MARDLSIVKTKFVNGMKSIYRASDYGENASSMTIEQLQRLVQQLYGGHNAVREAWDDFVALQGATTARELLAETVDSIPSDITTQLATMRTNIQAILNAYETTYGTGTANKTFSYTLSGGLFTGGFTESTVGAGALSNINSLCATLKTSVEALTPVS